MTEHLQRFIESDEGRESLARVNLAAAELDDPMLAWQINDAMVTGLRMAAEAVLEAPDITTARLMLAVMLEAATHARGDRPEIEEEPE